MVSISYVGQGEEEDTDYAEVLRPQHIAVSQIFIIMVTMIKIVDTLQIKMENNFHLHKWSLMQCFLK